MRVTIIIPLAVALFTGVFAQPESSHGKLQARGRHTVALQPTPVYLSEKYPGSRHDCSCHNPAPECVYPCQQQHCSSCHDDHRKPECPPYCQIYTTTATYEYPYTTLSATETCTMTLLSCDDDKGDLENDRECPYTKYPDHCEYEYPHYSPSSYGHGGHGGHGHGHGHALYPKETAVFPRFPVVHEKNFPADVIGDDGEIAEDDLD